MTPKDKANDLVNNYLDSLEINYKQARQCALIAADECLKTCVYSMIYYWQEVKHELLKL